MDAKMSTAMLAVIAAMALVGIGYAHWTETITISGTVDTGELDCGWSWETGWDTESDEKDVSSISAEGVDEDGDGDYDELVVTINNAYPCIHYYLPIDIKNTGTIPGEIASIDIDTSGLPSGSTVEIQEDPDKDPDIGVDVQIDPGEEAYGILHVHLPQDAEENTDYTFTVSVEFVQWND